MHIDCKHNLIQSDKYYDIKKSNAFSLSLSNLSSASDICCSPNPRSSNSPKRIKWSTICMRSNNSVSKERKNEHVSKERLNKTYLKNDFIFIPFYHLFPISPLFSLLVPMENPSNLYFLLDFETTLIIFYRLSYHHLNSLN